MGKASEIWKEIKPKIGEMLMVVNNIETQAEKAQEEAYQKGLSDGKNQDAKDFADMYDSGYSEGLKDAWEAARKIAHCFLWGNYQRETGRSSACAQAVLDHYSASEAIEKIRQEQKQEDKQLQVGDEVIAPFGTAVVTRIADDKIWFCYTDGHYGFDYKKDAPHKTGRHFPELVEVLQKMRERSEQDDND